MSSEMQELRDKIARVEALADKLAATDDLVYGGPSLVARAIAEEIRAALDDRFPNAV